MQNSCMHMLVFLVHKLHFKKIKWNSSSTQIGHKHSGAVLFPITCMTLSSSVVKWVRLLLHRKQEVQVQILPELTVFHSGRQWGKALSSTSTVAPLLGQFLICNGPNESNQNSKLKRCILPSPHMEKTMSLWCNWMNLKWTHIRQTGHST